MKLVLLHSPLTGPAVWQNLAPLLQARGFDALVPDYRCALSGPSPYYPNIVRAIAAEAGVADILIAHSGAGALIPALASTLRPVRDLYRQFADLGASEKHAFDAGAMSAEEAAAILGKKIEAGAFRLN